MLDYKTFVVQQSKGGVGKSHMVKLAAYYAMEKGLSAVFYNCDNESQTLTLFAKGIQQTKPKNVLFKDYDLLVNGAKFDVNKFDNLLMEIVNLKQETGLEKIDFVFIDMGARSSSEFLNYLNTRENIAEQLAKEYGFVFLPIISGGNMYQECLTYVKSFNKELAQNCKLICNTFNGRIDSKDIKYYFPTPTFDMSALEEFKDKLSKGFTPESLKNDTNLFRYPAFRKYLTDSNEFFDKLIYDEQK